MDKYVVYIETAGGFCGQDFSLTFDSIEEFKGWLISDQFEAYAAQMGLSKITLAFATTLQPAMTYDVELDY